MTAPPKPWEQVGGTYRIATDVPNPPNFSRGPVPVTIPSNGLPQPTTTTTSSQAIRTMPQASQGAPPPLPPRLNQFSTASTVRPMYSPYGGYSAHSGYSGYGGYSPFGGYGSYGNNYGYGGYGLNRYGGYMQRTEPESRFIQLAEESTRPAFQSIESLVQAFSSVTFMLESTFGAIHNSFRAVLGVAENMGRLRSVFGQFFSVFAIFRTLQWLYKKCLYLLGLIKSDPSQDEIWQQAASGVDDSVTRRISWPVLILMGLMLSGPYLMWKLLNTLKLSASSNSFDLNEWRRSRFPTGLAVAQYDFQAANEDELSVRAGSRVFIAPQDFQPQNSNGWILATVDGKRAGLVPANRLQLTGRMHYSNRQSQHIEPSRSAPSTATVPGNSVSEQSQAVPNLESLWTSEPKGTTAEVTCDGKQTVENCKTEEAC